MTESIYSKAMRILREKKAEEALLRKANRESELDMAVRSMAKEGHSVESQIASLLKNE